jgi:RNA polymerase sigma-70 factor, ECF subfamily
LNARCCPTIRQQSHWPELKIRRIGRIQVRSDALTFDRVSVQIMTQTSQPPGDAAPAVLVDPQKWVEEHGDALFRYALARVRKHQSAEDLVQETFLAAWKSRERFERRSSEKTWLYRILSNKIVDYFRAASRFVETTDIEELADFEAAQFKRGISGHTWARAAVPMSWTHVREAVEQGEFWNAVDHCIGKLPENIASVFLLREIEHLSTSEICDSMKIKRTHLFVLMHRARLALRRCLERNWFASPPSTIQPKN